MSWSTTAPVHQLNTSHAWILQGCNLEQLLVFKALQVSWQVHQLTSWTPLTQGWSMYAIQNHSLFLGLYKSANAWTIHVCNPEQLLVFRALPVGWRVHQSTGWTPAMRGRPTTPGFVGRCTSGLLQHLETLPPPTDRMFIYSALYLYTALHCTGLIHCAALHWTHTLHCTVVHWTQSIHQNFCCLTLHCTLHCIAV